MKESGKFWAIVATGLVTVGMMAGCAPVPTEAYATPTIEPTPTCVPMTPGQWQDSKRAEANNHLMSYQIYKLAAEGGMDHFGIYKMKAALELIAMENASVEANNLSALCGYPFIKGTPTPGK